MKLTTLEKSILIELVEKEIINLNKQESKYKEELAKGQTFEITDLINENIKSINARRKLCFDALRKVESEMSIND